jgi:hypothetical protein
MARPSLFVRPLTQGEMESVAHLRKSRRQALRQRAQILMACEKNVTFQRTRTWKRRPDPEFEQRATRIMALYRICPADGVVVCFDEFGPISLQPYPGHCYAQRTRPLRQRATYVRRGGVGYFLGAYDVHADVLFGGYRLAKTATEVLAFYKYIRRRYPDHLRIIWSTTISSCTGLGRSASGPRRTPHIEDAQLVHRLVEEDVCLDVCPTSNVHLGVSPSLEVHPLPALLQAGVPVSLNADDPVIFGCSLPDEYELARRALGCDDTIPATIAAQSLRASGASESIRSGALARIHPWLRTVTSPEPFPSAYRAPIAASASQRVSRSARACRPG